MDKKLNTDCTEDTDLTFSLIFLVGKWLLDLFSDFSGFASACGTPFFWKASDNILSNTSPYHTPRRKCPSTCNPAKSKLKSKNHWLNIIKKMYPWKTNPCSSVLSVFHFFDLWPCRRLGTQQQGINISVRIMCPSAYGDGQKFKHGLHSKFAEDCDEVA